MSRHNTSNRGRWFAAYIGVSLVWVVATWSCGFNLDSGQVECGPRAECPTEFECRYDGRCYRKGVGLSTHCDDGTIDGNETCDPPGSCPSSCDDGNACTIDNKVGSARTCNVGCLRTVINACIDDDGCCPEGCTFDNDTDCSATCGNGEIDDKETCDPQESCPTSCDDKNECTEDIKTGSASNCNASCGAMVISECGPDEGCCPAGCNSTTDPDCSANCGNDLVELQDGETCDPPASCPTLADCDDDRDCTVDGLTGSAGNCNAKCTHTQITACVNGDGCCPAGCPSDTDCATSCNHDGVCDYPDETPTTCGDDDCTGCMDGYCDAAGGENYVNCFPDCHCGDGDCDIANENPSNCNLDCFCGNTVCEPWENSSGCSMDCGGGGGCDGGGCDGGGGGGCDGGLCMDGATG